MRRCCALGVLLAASTTQSLSFTAQPRLSRVHPARRTAPPTLGAYIDLTGLECEKDSANVMSTLNPNAAVFVPQA